MNLQLPLKAKWFDMTEKGLKLIEYREITPYWCNRLLLQNGRTESKAFWDLYLLTYGVHGLKAAIETQDKTHRITFKNFEVNTMTLGYPPAENHSKILKFHHQGIEISKGDVDKGATPEVLYFCIKHGNRL